MRHHILVLLTLMINHHNKYFSFYSKGLSQNITIIISKVNSLHLNVTLPFTKKRSHPYHLNFIPKMTLGGGWQVGRPHFPWEEAEAQRGDEVVMGLGPVLLLPV